MTTNRKFEFIADGTTARLLVTEVHGRFDWRSVALTGPVRAVDPDGPECVAFVDTLDRTAARFSSDFERAGGVEELRGWRLYPAELRGLEVRGDAD
jgi:nitroimidazol reductase NimA-like FMN-containing flavoprotein (pyridoxamine 5'-phosphate oxidase superfamily)